MKDYFGLKAHISSLVEDFEKTEDTVDKIKKSDLSELIKEVTIFMSQNGLELRPYPKIKFITDDTENSKDPLGRTGHYDPETRTVCLYTLKRHPKDVLRTYTHELIHHMQNLQGRLENINTTNVNEDSNLEKLEEEAISKGGLYFRKWENSRK
jgi:hypothetical protein